MDINIKLIDGGKMPEYKHDSDACADCCARIAVDVLTIPAGGRCLVPLGFALELPDGYEAVIRPRSGLSKIGVDSAIGTIDSGFRDEISACLINNTGEERKVVNGDRICQMKIQEARKFNFVQVDELSDSDRGKNGWGSTGMR